MISSKEQKFIQSKLKNVTFNQSMMFHSTARIGGKVDIFVCPETIKELKAALSIAKNINLEPIIIGNASNIIFNSGRISGMVISLKNIKGIKVNNKLALVETMAGEMISHVFAVCKNSGLSGFESLCGIPGTIGGSIVNNAGAFGVEISSMIREVKVLLPSLKVKTLKKEDMDFGYRYSSLKNKNYVVISALFKLSHLAPSVIQSVAQQQLNERKEHQPTSYSAGCVFKKCGNVSAGELIDRAGLKGTKIGGCEISSKHANFIINNGNGTSSDYKKLVSLAQKTVKEKFNKELQTEVEFIG